MPANETELLLAFAELTSKIEALLEKQDELVDAMSKLKEAVYKRAIKRLTNEQRRVKKARKTDHLVERIFARLQKESKKR